MGPVIFAGYAADMARRAAAGLPARVLETAAGTGIVARALRDTFPISAQLTATDLNVGMVEIARTKVPPQRAGGFPAGGRDRAAIPQRLDFRAFARGVVFGNSVFDQTRQRGGEEPDRIQ